MNLDYESGYNLNMYTIMCKKCRHIYYMPTNTDVFYKYCPHCKTKLKLERSWSIND